MRSEEIRRLEEIERLKEELGLTTDRIESSAGISLRAVQAFFRAVEGTPEGIIAEAIDRILPGEMREHDEGTGNVMSGDVAYRVYSDQKDMLAEPEAAYDRFTNQGGYTLKDYYALPDERRVELIDGVFYDMAVPAVIHQLILGDLFILFRECMDSHEGECEVFLSPCDVRLDRDNRTMVQPDLLVLCRAYDLGAKRFEGAPDLTLEILSPSTRSKDMLLKLHKYANAGVREYWIVDPEQRTVLVYDLEREEEYPRKYDFEDNIPIGISGGTCGIDFSRILRRIERHYE